MFESSRQPNIATMVDSGDFEAVVSFGVGLMKRTSVLRTPATDEPEPVRHRRAHELRSHAGEDVLLRRATVRGQHAPPFFRAVRRLVQVPGIGRSALHRLYAGPTRGRPALAAVAIDRVQQPVDRLEHREGPAVGRMQRRRIDGDGRRRDHADPNAVPHGAPGSRSTTHKATLTPRPAEGLPSSNASSRELIIGAWPRITVTPRISFARCGVVDHADRIVGVVQALLADRAQARAQRTHEAVTAGDTRSQRWARRSSTEAALRSAVAIVSM
jgi:hypothetical protein